MKIDNLLARVGKVLESGGLKYSTHAELRMVQRKIIKPEVEFILKRGHHNPKKDKFNKDYDSWDYAIEGKTIDNRKLRIIVAVVDPNILVVTAIIIEN